MNELTEEQLSSLERLANLTESQDALGCIAVDQAELLALISAARERERYKKDLKMMLVGSCSCLTKTPEVRFHDEYCRYRIISEALGTPKELHPPASGMETSND